MCVSRIGVQSSVNSGRQHTDRSNVSRLAVVRSSAQQHGRLLNNISELFFLSDACTIGVKTFGVFCAVRNRN